MAATIPDSVAVANRLRPVLLQLNRQLRAELHLLGVSAGQVSILGAIREKPGVGVAELAAREGTSAPTICSHIDRLEASRLVTRTREETGDRRRVGLHVTADGERVLRTVRSRRTAWLASRLDTLSSADRARIADSLDALAQLVEQR